MNRKDPLEQAFELLKADSKGLAFNSDLECKLMNELERRNKPRRLRRAALAAALLVGALVAGSGISWAAGYNPFKVFKVTDASGTTWTLVSE